MSDTLEKKQKAAFLESIRNGSSRKKSCQACGIGTTTFWKWKQDDPNFKADLESALESRISVVEDSLYRLAVGRQKRDKDGEPVFDKQGNPILLQSNGQVVALIFWLKNRGKGQWRDKHDIEVIAPKIVNQKTFIQAGQEPKIIEEKEIHKLVEGQNDNVKQKQ